MKSKRPAIFFNADDDDEDIVEAADSTRAAEGKMQIGPWLHLSATKSSDHIVFPDSRRGWSALLQLGNGSQVDVGSFPTRFEAETSHDIQALTLHGLTRDSEINTNLTLAQSRDIRLIQCGSDRRIELLCPSSASVEEEKAHSIVIDPVKSELEYKILPPDIAVRSFGGDAISKVVNSDTGQAASSYNFSTAWRDRCSSAYTQSVSFVYEVTFNHQNSLGLNLKSHFIPFALGASKKQLGCLMVVESNPTLGVIVRPGDMLVKVNNIDLASANTAFNFDVATK